jgi:rubrerythrin
MLKSRTVSRRALLADAGKLTLSAGAIALLAGNDALANAHAEMPSKDTAILNVALALEHEGIAAYQIGAESGLLSKDVLPVAVLFQSHHKAHRDALTSTIEKLGGKPAQALPMDAYVKSAKLNIAAVKSQADVLKLAQRLELGATNAYLGVIPSFADRELAKVAARLAADETMHYTALTQALGESVPSAALFFGG